MAAIATPASPPRSQQSIDSLANPGVAPGGAPVRTQGRRTEHWLSRRAAHEFRPVAACKLALPPMPTGRLRCDDRHERQGGSQELAHG